MISWNAKARSYCAGILFNETQTKCALIEKTKPAWQAGYLNAIGGSIEGNESAGEAMEREFLEEAGILVENWTRVLEVSNGDALIHFFKALVPDEVLGQVRTASGEGTVAVHNVSYIIHKAAGEIIPNLRWIIPVMLAHGVQPFLVTETTRGGFSSGT